MTRRRSACLLRPASADGLQGCCAALLGADVRPAGLRAGLAACAAPLTEEIKCCRIELLLGRHGSSVPRNRIRQGVLTFNRGCRIIRSQEETPPWTSESRTTSPW